MPSFLLLVRAAVLATTNTFASVTLGLAIYQLFLSFLHPRRIVPAIIAAFFHLVSVTTMVVICRARRGAFTSKVSFEVWWLSFLCVLWLAAGVVIVGFSPYIFLCSDFSICGAIQAVVVLAFLNSLLLLGYVITLIVVAVAAGKAGRSIWSSDVKEIRRTQGLNSYENGNFNRPNPTMVPYPPVGNPNHNVPPVMSQSQPYYQQQGWPQA